MKVIEFIHLVARTRSEDRQGNEWKNACDYIAHELILQQPDPVHRHLEDTYRGMCEHADSNAHVFVKKARKTRKKQDETS